MKFAQYFHEARSTLNTEYARTEVSFSIFDKGGIWMQENLISLAPERFHKVENSVNFTRLGVLKYLFCLLPSLSLIPLLSYFQVHGSLIFIASCALFYLIEAPMVFLFPLSIERNRPSWRVSATLTFNIGWLKVIFTVIPIAIFMVFGLLNFTKPLKNWHLGALVILIWYLDETSDRT
ncbi:hypothetical protein GYB22_01210 [bacterium]|nr:hypothetical protein [bacterium]